MIMNLAGKIAIVTGAGSGIGKAFSKALVEKGVNVYGIGRNLTKLTMLEEELGNLFSPIKLDLTKHKDIEQWVAQVFNKNHNPDILINNAGVGHMKPVEELSVAEWDAMMLTNLSGVFYLTRLVVPHMKANAETNHIINIASIAGLMGNPLLSGYNATKFGLRGFSDALFKELRNDRIKVTCMLPGSIETPFFDSIEAITANPNMLQAEDVATLLIQLLETPDNFLVSEVTLRPLIA